MSTTSYKVSDGLWLVHQGVAKKAAAKPADVPVHHVAVIDCSGSMSWDLPQIREQLKRKLPKLLREKDTFSLIWFSGRDEYGVLFQGEPVATLTDLKTVEQAIDRWLKPVGLTGFKQPLETVATVAAKLRSSGPKDAAVALFFLSDGCDNQWSRGDVLKAMEKAAGAVSSVTVVEYGYYAGRDLLADMTAKAGGTHIFAETFDKYVPSFEAAMQRRITGAPRVEAKVAGDPVCGIAFSMVDNEITAYEASGGSVMVPEDLAGFWYLSPSPVGKASQEALQDLSKASSSGGTTADAVDAAYAAISLLSVRMKPDTVLPLLKGLGDVKLIQAFGGCFGKQKYSEFVDLSKDAAFGKGRFEQGWDPSKVPADDAFTVLDLIRIISEDDRNRVLFDDPSFKYSPIGRGRVDSSTVLTAKEQKEVAELSAELAKTKDPSKLKEINARIAAITATKGEALKFEESAKEAGDEGYPVSSLTYNEDRPNVSVLVRKEGTVNLASRLPAALKGTKVGSGVPETFSTFIFRNYTIIKDGLVNVKQLPVALTTETLKRLDEAGCPAEVRVGKAEQAEGSRIKLTVDLSKLPIINRRMVKEVSARTLFETEWELTKARAAQKVYNAFKKEIGESKKSATFDALYGADGAAWLKEQGFTDYSGFSPKSVLAEAKDVYKAKELKVSLKGYSSFPTLAKYREAVQKGKLNGPAELMKPHVDEVDAFLASDVYKKASDQGALFAAWIDPKAKDATAKVRGLLSTMAEIKFSIVVGQVWPKEFKSIEENSMDLTLDGKLLSFKVEQNEKDEPI